MPQVLIRELDERTLQRLKLRAKHHRRSLEAELRTILDLSARESFRDPKAFVDEVRARFAGRTVADSTDLIRADRDR